MNAEGMTRNSQKLFFIKMKINVAFSFMLEQTSHTVNGSDNLELENMMNAQQLAAKLPKIESLDEKFDVVEVNTEHFIKDGVLMVSNDSGQMAIDYYGEYRGGYPWINPKLEQFAKENGHFWEWRDPGTIALYPN